MRMCDCGRAPAIAEHEYVGYCAECLYRAETEAAQLFGLQVLIDALRAAAGWPNLDVPCPVCDSTEHDGSEARIEECGSIANACSEAVDPEDMRWTLERRLKVEAQRWN